MWWQKCDEYNNCILNKIDLASTTGWAKKRATLLLSISSPIIDRFSKFFHWQTLQTSCDNVIIIDSTTLYMHLYTILWNINEMCIHNGNNKQAFW